MLALVIAVIGLGAVIAAIYLPTRFYWLILALVVIQVALGIIINQAWLLLIVVAIIGVLFTALIAVSHFCIDKDAERTTDASAQ